MKYFLIVSFFIISCQTTISKKDIEPRVDQHLKIISSDAMKGRAALSKDIRKTEDYIGGVFQTAKLKPFQSFNGYRHEFTIYQTEILNDQPKLLINEKEMTDLLVVTKNTVDLKNSWEKIANEFEIIELSDSKDLGKLIFQEKDSDKKIWVWADQSLAGMLPRFQSYYKHSTFTEKSAGLIVVAVKPEGKVRHIHLQANVSEKSFTAANMIGYLEGSDPVLKKEYILFGAHHDHLGVKANETDSIYNGADDNGSGVSSILTLAEYFSSNKTYKRSLIFATFTAEEMGLIGSNELTKSLPFQLDQIKAMVNIEMVGTESQWGFGNAYITGSDRTDLMEILNDAMEDNVFTLHPDPYTQMNLFYRSDNASLAKKGIVAHTIATVDMNKVKTYHQPNDEYQFLNSKNISRVISGIIDGVKPLISGEKTPRYLKEN